MPTDTTIAGLSPQQLKFFIATTLAEDLVRKGRDIERRVLSRAVSWHLRRRVLRNGDKTIVFAN